MKALTRIYLERTLLVWIAVWLFLTIKGVLPTLVFMIPLAFAAMYFFPLRLLFPEAQHKGLNFTHSVYLSAICVLLILRFFLEMHMAVKVLAMFLSIASWGFLYWAYSNNERSLLITTIVAFLTIGSVFT
jgi:hypothetical protein